MYPKKANNLIKALKGNAVVANIFIVACITVAVKVFGFYKEVVIASEFGLSEVLDTFLIALLIPGFINNVFLSAFKSVFIPNYIAEEKINKNIGAFQTTSFVITILASLFFMLVAYLVTDVFLEILFPGKSDNYYILIKSQFYYLLPCVLIWGLTSLLSGLLNIYKEFIFSSLYPLITSVSMVISIVFYRNELGENVLAIGMLIGAVIQALLLVFVSLYHKILKFDFPDILWKNAGYRRQIGRKI